MTKYKVAIGNVFTQQVVKSLDLSKEHKPVVLTFIQPEFKDCYKDGKIIDLKPTVILKRSMITERFYKYFDNRFNIEIE